MSERVRIAVVGSGPAGLAAAARAAVRGVSHVLLERGDLANTVHRYSKGKHVMAEPNRLPLQPELPVGFAAGSREEVLESWALAASKANVQLRIGSEFEVSSISGQKGQFVLDLKGGGSVSAEWVLLGIGDQGTPRRFGVPGDGLPHVAHQLDDPAAFEDQRILVVGVGDSGIENALALVEYDNDVTVVNRSSEIDRATAANKERLLGAAENRRLRYYTETRVVRFELGLAVLDTRDGAERVPVDLVIGRLGGTPPRRFLESIGIAFQSEDADSLPRLTEECESSVPGIYLIGTIAGCGLIKQCLNQGFEVVERILGHDVVPADEGLIEERLRPLGTDVSALLAEFQQRIPLLRPLARTQLRELARESSVRRVRTGDVIIERNDYSDTLLAIVEGRVTVIAPASDADTDVNLPESSRRYRHFARAEGEFVGEGSLLSGRRRSATVKAASDGALLQIPRLVMTRLRKVVPEVRAALDATSMTRLVESAFPEADPAELATLCRRAEVKTFEQGERLFSEGDLPDGLHLIRRGAVGISWLRDSKEITIDYVHAGRLIGETALVQPAGRRTASVTATVYTETILLPEGDIKSFLADHPEVERRFWDIASRYGAMNTARVQNRAATNLLAFLVSASQAERPKESLVPTDLLLIDESLCVRCDNCERACAETHGGVSRLDREAGPTFGMIHVPTTCRHCENPACMSECPVDAIRRHPTGEVYIRDNCIGCEKCIEHCPYGVIQLAEVRHKSGRSLLMRLLFGVEDPVRKRMDEAEPGSAGPKKLAVKCDLCVSVPRRGRRGSRAECEAACPTGALRRASPSTFIEELFDE